MMQIYEFKMIFSHFVVGSSTTLLIQNMRNKKGHFSADAELEDDEGTSHKAPKKKGPNVVKF